MNFKTLLIAGVVAFMILMGSWSFMKDLGSGYNMTVSDVNGSFANTSRVLNIQNERMQAVYNNLSATKFDSPTNLFLTPYRWTVAGWNGLLVLFGTKDTVEGVLSDSTNVLQSNGITIPSWVTASIILIILIIIVVLILELFFKWRLET